jgi:acetylornithine/succinyldiaminopimelate/putrescine aminotransferase
VTDPTAAVVLEVVQGESGVNLGTPDFMKTAQRVCRERGAVLIVDEIQTGFGRTGTWFAIEHAGIEPDIMCLSKGLGGGFPMGAFAYTKKIRDVLTPGAHGSTFGGSPLACAAGLAAIDAYRDEGLIKRSDNLGADMRNQLRGALEGVAMVREIRGLGLMIAVELRTKVAPVLKSRCSITGSSRCGGTDPVPLIAAAGDHRGDQHRRVGHRQAIKGSNLMDKATATEPVTDRLRFRRCRDGVGGIYRLVAQMRAYFDRVRGRAGNAVMSL